MSEDGGEDKSSKTEDPTQHRLDEAEKKGQIVYSRELNNFFIMVALAFVISWSLPSVMEDAKAKLTVYLSDADDFEFGFGDIQILMTRVALEFFSLMIVPIGIITVLVVGVAMMQSKLLFAAERIKPKFEKISPVKGLGRMFSMRSVVEFGKGVLKLSVIAIAGYLVIKGDLGALESLPNFDLTNMLKLLSGLAMKIMVAVCCAMFFIAILDYVYQRFDFMKSMRMSKQELKEEHKQQEGDPHIKGKLRQIRMERARKRMMAAVPNADVVVTNPTHFAVALTYETGTMRAPVVVAKGADKVAFRIREIAKENDVPIVENPPLARTLFATSEVDEEIPYEHYKAVAEVIGYVYRLKGKIK